MNHYVISVTDRDVQISDLCARVSKLNLSQIVR